MLRSMVGPDARLRTSAFLALVLATLLSACGGGSSEEPTPIPTGPPGTLDETFGVGGIVLAAPSEPAAANAMVLQPDGKIVVVGSIGEGGAKRFYLSRYKSDGTLDAAFGSGGVVTTVFDSAAGSEALAVLLQPDGKIVGVGGSAGACALARYNTDGSLDSAFGTEGTVLARSARDEVTCTAAALQPDGKVVAAVLHGPVKAIGFSNLNGSVMRFDANGGRDATFSAGGEAAFACGVSACEATSVAIQPTGEIVVAGMGWSSAPFGGSTLVLMARFGADGALDPRFGPGEVGLALPTGYSQVDYSFFNCLPTGLIIQPDGKFVVFWGSALSDPPPTECVGLDRVLAAGSRDRTFGIDGRADFPGTAAGINSLSAFALQTDGKIVAAGASLQYTADSPQLQSAGLVRYHSNGTFDTEFGNAGMALVPIAGSSRSRGVVVLPDGRIVVAGNITTASAPQAIFVARYFGSPL